MRPPARLIAAFLGLLVPLAALAWLGSAELRRQADRADKALVDHASTFLREASRQLEDDLVRRTARVRAPFAIEFLPLVRFEQRVLEEPENAARGLIVLDADGALIHPDAGPSDMTLPFMTPPPSPEIEAAERLLALGDLEGARLLLDKYLNSRSRRGPQRYRQHAHFRLATVLRRLGDYDAAEPNFVAASRAGARDNATIGLLADIALVEIDVVRTGDQTRTVELQTRIANGEHYRDVADPVLAEAMLYLDELVPVDSALRPSVQAALATDSVRRDGRAFADGYDAYRRGSVLRQLRANVADVLTYVCHDSAAGASLLVLRRISDDERFESLGELDDAEWIGLRYDLDTLLESILDRLLEPSSAEFYVAIESPDGSPILPRNAPSQLSDQQSSRSDEPPGRADDLLPRYRSLAGMMVHAELAHPDRYFEERSDTARNHSLLVLALCLLAGGGAFFMIRSVARESEIVALKMQLVSRVSHELKTPLALIRMYGETLERGRTTSPEQVAHFSGIITREAERLTTMIQRVLDFARRESGEAHFDKRPTELGAIVDSVLDAYEPRAAARGITLRAVGTDREITAFVDAEAFGGAVVNLVENAVKYTPERDPDSSDAPAIEVNLSSDGVRAILEVADRGVGIPSGELDRVFTSFYRASNAAETPGAGLGLSLVRSFAEGHGGKASAHNRAGGGTVIRLELPLTSLSAESDE